jgi:hypothetical protein
MPTHKMLVGTLTHTRGPDRCGFGALFPRLDPVRGSSRPRAADHGTVPVWWFRPRPIRQRGDGVGGGQLHAPPARLAPRRSWSSVFTDGRAGSV